MKKILTSRWPGLVLAAAGILMMGYGIFRGEMAVVFTKAVRYLYGVYRHWIRRKASGTGRVISSRPPGLPSQTPTFPALSLEKSTPGN